ncbi:MAG: DHH family phosphoesterase, partial [Thermoplasmatales archaeon]
MGNEILERSKKAAEMILSFPKSTRIRVVSHYDADGITAAAIICITLYRLGYNFHVSLMRNPFTEGLERIKKEENELIIFTDMGSGQIELIEQMGCKSIVIDHHQYIKKKTHRDIFQINANLFGINGDYEACGATLSLSIAKAIDKKNSDLVDLALSGATGDKQYIGGIRGYNKSILDEGLKNGFLKQRKGIKLSGSTLFDDLYHSIDPYYAGLSGNENEINKLLKKLHIDKETKIEDLSRIQRKQFQSFLLFKLIKNGCEKNIIDTIIRERYWSDRLNFELERFADLIDACGKGGNRELGLAVCMGDDKALKDALKIEMRYKQEILKELIQLEKGGIKEKSNFRYLYSKD